MNPEIERASELYQRTEYQQALRLLETSKDRAAPAYALMGQCYYMLGEFKKATEMLEKAVAAGPRNAGALDWLGKAYGRRAESSSFLTAPSYAVKARKYFEQAVEADPQNMDAADDLFEYYLAAPGFLGGGEEKAASLAARFLDRQPVATHSMQARLEEKRKRFQAAEEQWRRAAELAPAESGRFIDLAKFFARRGRYSESEEAFRQAEAIAPHRALLQFEKAKAYIQSRRHPEEARRLLQEYLNAPLTPDDPPREEARQLLKSMTSG